MNILEKQLELSKSGKNYALITVAEVSGGSAYEVGKKMLLVDDGKTYGSVGGGTLELEILQDAADAIQNNKGYIKEYKHGHEDESEGLGCRFTTKIFVEVFRPVPHLVVCGGGHVGGAILELADFLGFDTTLIDTRKWQDLGERAQFADNFVETDNYELGVLEADVPDNAYYFCCASTHTQDKSALKGALQRSFKYVGMLGSRQKTLEIFPQLEAEGIDEALLKKVYTPAGLDINDLTPEEVAFSIMAEILLIKNNKTLGHRMRE